jgi:hypothetical protein
MNDAEILRALADRQQITGLIYRYCRSVTVSTSRQPIRSGMK